MYTTKTGIEMPELKDRYDGPFQILKVLQQIGEVLDRLAEQIEEIKNESKDTGTDS